jgi:hypothetical protein
LDSNQQPFGSLIALGIAVNLAFEVVTDDFGELGVRLLAVPTIPPDNHWAAGAGEVTPR